MYTLIKHTNVDNFKNKLLWFRISYVFRIGRVGWYKIKNIQTQIKLTDAKLNKTEIDKRRWKINKKILNIYLYRKV